MVTGGQGNLFNSKSKWITVSDEQRVTCLNKESCSQKHQHKTIILPDFTHTLWLIEWDTSANVASPASNQQPSVCVPCRRSLEVSEVCMKNTDAVVTHDIDEVYVSEPGSQLPDHLPPVLQQHGVQLALITTQRKVPGQDVVSVGVVEHWGDTGRIAWQLWLKYDHYTDRKSQQ